MSYDTSLLDTVVILPLTAALIAEYAWRWLGGR